MAVEVMPWDRGVLASAAGLGDPRTNPRVLGAVLVDLAVRGHLTITATAVDTFLVRPAARLGGAGPPGGSATPTATGTSGTSGTSGTAGADGRGTRSARPTRPAELRPDETIVRNLVASAAPGSPDGASLLELRRDPVFARAWYHLLAQLATSGAPGRGGRRPSSGADDAGADAHDLTFGLRVAVGVASIAAGAVGWQNPVFVIGGLLGLAATVLVPDARPQVVRGRSVGADLEEVDRSVLSIAASGAQRIDHAAYERALPYGVLVGRNLDLWAVLADSAYPDGCPWFTLGPGLERAGRAAPPPGGAEPPAGTAAPPAGAATPADAAAPAPAGAPPDHGAPPAEAPRDVVRVPGVAALLRAFCLQAAQDLVTPETATVPPAGRP